MPSEARKTASSVPTTTPVTTASPTIPTPRPRNQTYGIVTRTRPARARARPSSFPSVISSRGTGVRSRLSSVPRSRSPLIVSAAREQREQRADRDRDLQHQVDRLAMLEEVQRAVRRDEVGDHAQQQAEREAEQRGRARRATGRGAPARRRPAGRGARVSRSRITRLRHREEGVAQPRAFELGGEHRDAASTSARKARVHRVLALCGCEAHVSQPARPSATAARRPSPRSAAQRGVGVFGRDASRPLRGAAARRATSATVPCAATRPRLRISTREQISSTSASRCVLSSTVAPRSPAIRRTVPST